MESVTMLSKAIHAPPLPPKVKTRTSNEDSCEMKENCDINIGGSPAVSLTGSKTVSASSVGCGGSRGSLSSSTVFLGGGQHPLSSPLHSVDNTQRSGHVVTIRINPESYQSNISDNTNGFHKESDRHSIPRSEDRTYKSQTKVSLNQSSPINTIGKFIVNICENSEGDNKSNEVYLNTKTQSSNGCVRISVGSTEFKSETKEEMVQKSETIMKTATNGNMSSPYFFCNSFPYTQGNLMPSGQCSPSDTLDSGTCSDLDGTPPPLPKKKLSKCNGTGHKRVSVTVIGGNAHSRAPSVISSGAEVDSEDSESNISCDSLNSSELSAASLHEDAATFKSEVLKPQITGERRKCDSADQVDSVPPQAPKMPTYISNKPSVEGFLPQGLLQDIRDRSAKLSAVTIEENVNKISWADIEKKPENIQIKKDLIKPEEKLTSFKLVSQVNNENRKPRITDVLFSQNISQELMMSPCQKVLPIVNESTYVDRKLQQDKQKQDQLYSGNYIYDTDKYYDFHLNENVFDTDSETEKKPKKRVGVNVNGKGLCNGSSDSELYDNESMEYFAGLKDYKAEEGPAAIRSAKGTIRGVKNRVRAGIATFLQMQNTTVKSYKEKDAGKVVLYTTSMGIVRGTYQKCVLVKKILRNLLIKFEERDVFMSGEYQEEIKDRMRSSDVLVPQLFVEGQHIGDADTVERLNEAGELRRMLKPYKSADACTTCQMCGGYRLLPCQVCSGSKKSVHRNHFTAEFVALKCMNCDEVGLVKCDAC